MRRVRPVPVPCVVDEDQGALGRYLPPALDLGEPVREVRVEARQVSGREVEAFGRVERRDDAPVTVEEPQGRECLTPGRIRLEARERLIAAQNSRDASRQKP